MLQKIVELFGRQGLRLLTKILFIVAGFSLFSIKPDFLATFLSKSFLGLDLVMGTNILGILLLLFAWLFHKNYI